MNFVRVVILIITLIYDTIKLIKNSKLWRCNMENILAFSLATIAFLFFIIAVSKSVIHSDLGDWCKIIILAVLNFVIYCLLQYSYGFIQWTIRLNKFDSYPYKNPFCMLVIIYCIISFILLGIQFIKYEKNEYGIKRTVLFLFAIHILAILLVIFFSPFNNWF